jgi:WD40-like Beta Propeller Repeat
VWQGIQECLSLAVIRIRRLRRLRPRTSGVACWFYLLVFSVLGGMVIGLFGLANQTDARETGIMESIPPPPPVPLSFTPREIPKPPGVKNWSHPRFSPDGEWLAFHFSSEESQDTFRLGKIRLDETAFQCFTCDQQLDARRPVWFPDGKRMMFQTPHGLTNIFYVLELDQGKIYEIQGMRLRPVLDHDRWTMLSRDAAKLIWTKVWVDGFRVVMGAFVKDEQGYRVEDVRLIYPPSIADDSNTEQWEQALAWYENKHLTDGGKTLVFAGSRDQGANLDVYLLDLEIGAVHRLTNHREWDEGGEFSPDGTLFAFETTRAHEVLSVLAHVPIPAFLDFALVLPIRNVTLTGPWFAPHEPFIIDKFGDRGDYIGQRLSVAGDQGWAIRGGVHWHHDGTKITWSEWLNPDQIDSRIFVGEFSGLTPGQPLPQAPTQRLTGPPCSRMCMYVH